jgi:hypothetical protein
VLGGTEDDPQPRFPFAKNLPFVLFAAVYVLVYAAVYVRLSINEYAAKKRLKQRVE